MLNTKYNIVLIEKNQEMQRSLARILKKKQYKSESFMDVKTGLDMVANQCPDLVLLDRDYLGIDAKDCIEQMRKWTECPIIVLSAVNDVRIKIDLLENGADDYVVKPFNPDELMARIHTCLRRVRLREKTTCYRRDGLLVDFDKRNVMFSDELVHFTPVEYRIVEYLALNSGKVITYDNLLSKIWGPFHKESDNRILRVNMANIRRKLEKVTQRTDYIYTESGVGYRMCENQLEQIS